MYAILAAPATVIGIILYLWLWIPLQFLAECVVAYLRSCVIERAEKKVMKVESSPALHINRQTIGNQLAIGNRLLQLNK